MKLRIVLEPSEDGGYTAVVPALPGCLSEGETREEALANVQEAIELYLEPVEDDWELSPEAEVLEVVLWMRTVCTWVRSVRFSERTVRSWVRTVCTSERTATVRS
jgi:predicted RNase H-like HicB family nuclease